VEQRVQVSKKMEMRKEYSEMSDELATLDATAAAELVRAGKISPLELVDEAIARIEKTDGRLNAVITPLFEKARDAAASALPDGPFRGVPFLLKDLDVFSEGDPFHGGMRFLKQAGYVPGHSSYLVEKFRRAGLVTLGKTNTPELGLHVTTEPEAYGPSRNPWNPAHSTGGSSGGSAAAVASGMVPAAHASDGGGSIRVPASECGLVGLKPSRGRISLGPEYGEYWQGLVTSHVVCRSVRDTAGLLDASAGPMPGDPYNAPPPLRPYVEEVEADPGRLRIGLMPKSPLGAPPCDGECTAAVEEAGKLLESLGHHVSLAHPDALDEHGLLVAGFSAIVACWTAKGLARWGEVIGRPVREGDVEAGTWELARPGEDISAVEYLTAVERLHAWSRRMARWWAEDFDLLVTPTIAAPPPRIGELGPGPDDDVTATEKIFGLIAFTPQFNVTGQPAVSLPLAWSSECLPMGVQFVAATAREDLLIRVASQLERARPWSHRRPPIWASSKAPTGENP
jgi:amidase